MARFFLPPLPDGAPSAETAYRDLRDQAEARTGEVSRERRIEGLLCRRSGRDCQLLVGELDADNGRIVTAIIQAGRDAYTVHHQAPDAGGTSEVMVLRGCDVYAVTEFQ